MRKLNRPIDVFWVKEVLAEASGYDFVVLDTAAAITVYSLNALVASQYVVIPATPEYQPIEGAEQTFRTATMVREKLNPTLNDPLFLLTQVDRRKVHHKYYRKYLRGRYGDLVMQSEIRTSTSLAGHFSDGSSVFIRNPNSRGALDYANATDELLRRVGLLEKNHVPA
jgi:chromosome partitioning protein